MKKKQHLKVLDVLERRLQIAYLTKGIYPNYTNALEEHILDLYNRIDEHYITGNPCDNNDDNMELYCRAVDVYNNIEKFENNA